MTMLSVASATKNSLPYPRGNEAALDHSPSHMATHCTLRLFSIGHGLFRRQDHDVQIMGGTGAARSRRTM